MVPFSQRPSLKMALRREHYTDKEGKHSERISTRKPGSTPDCQNQPLGISALLCKMKEEAPFSKNIIGDYIKIQAP